MMVYTKNLILVCTGRDTTKAASLGMPVLQLCLGISQSGALQRLKVSAVQRHCLLGVTDPPQAINFCSAERIAADLVFEARRTEAPGVFADFEHDTPLNRRLLAAFDEALYDADIPLYVPLECGRTLSHAILTVSTAISGGSLTEYISSPAGHLQRCADCRVSAAGFAGFHPAVTHAERHFTQCRSKSRAARADRRTAVLFARAVRKILHLHECRRTGTLCPVRR